MRKALNLILILLIVTSCSDEEDNPTGGGLTGINQKVMGTSGANIEMTLPDGSTETLTGDDVEGWDHGMWMNSNYFRLADIRLGDNTLTFRISVPEGKSFADVVEDEFELQPVFLILRNTGDLDQVYPELYFRSSTSFEERSNFFGSVTIHRNKSVGGTEYDVVGEIDASFEGRDFKGFFWLEDAEW